MTRKINQLEVLRIWSRGEFDPDLLAGVSGRALGAIVSSAAEQEDPVQWLFDQGFGVRDVPLIMRMVNSGLVEIASFFDSGTNDDVRVMKVKR